MPGTPDNSAAPAQQAPQPAAPQTSAPASTSQLPARDVASVEIGSVADDRQIPAGSTIISCAGGCMSNPDRSQGALRAFTDDQIRPGYDPRTATVTLDESDDATRSGWSGNLLSRNPNGFTDHVGVPVPDRPTVNSGVGAGGNVSKPGKGAVVDISGGEQVELRVAKAVPDRSYSVNTQVGPGTVVHYHYEYEMRTRKSLAFNQIQGFHRSDWSPVSQDQFNSLVARGAFRPVMTRTYERK